MTLLAFLTLNFFISVMQWGNTSLMDISEDLFSESLGFVVASERNLLIGVDQKLMMGGIIFLKNN